jgi:hypothetical protein
MCISAYLRRGVWAVVEFAGYVYERSAGRPAGSATPQETYDPFKPGPVGAADLVWGSARCIISSLRILELQATTDLENLIRVGTFFHVPDDSVFVDHNRKRARKPCIALNNSVGTGNVFIEVNFIVTQERKWCL